MTQDFSLVLSLLALFLGAANFWFQHFYRLDEVSCLLTSFFVKRWQGFSAMKVHISIGNSGTRPVMLNAATLNLTHRKNLSSKVGISANTGTNIVLPILIEKGQLIDLELSQQLTDDLLVAFQRQHLPDYNPRILGPFEYDATLNFVTVDGDEMRFSEPIVVSQLIPGDWVTTNTRSLKVRAWKLSVPRFPNYPII